jgi:hypothetical protein
MTTTTTRTRKATTPAKKAAPAKATKAAPKAPAKAAPTPAERKLRWIVDGDRAQAGKTVGQSATVDGHEYKIEKAGDAWVATHTLGRKKTVLSDTTYARAYAACVQHNRQR